MAAKNSGKTWTPSDNREFKALVKGSTPTRVVGLKMGRSESSVQSHAQSLGVSLKPTNQSLYNRRKTS